MVPGLLLWRTRRPLTLSLMSMPLCNRWERILVRECRQMRCMISVDRDQNGSITYSSKAISENMVINNGRANVWAGTMVNVSVRGNDGILEVMKPQINYAPAMLVGKVVVSEGASLRTHGAVDTSKADVSLENSAWTIIADITTTNQNTPLNLANLAMSGANVIMMAEPVTRSSVTASAENFTTLTTNTLSGNGNFLYAYRYG